MILAKETKCDLLKRTQVTFFSGFFLIDQIREKERMKNNTNDTI